MPSIDGNKKICTLINVFTVDPEKHVALFEYLKEATENVMSKMPGYISASLHISDDKKTITNYAQWTSFEDFQNKQKNDEAGKHMKAAASIAKEFKPVTYSEIWTHSK